MGSAEKEETGFTVGWVEQAQTKWSTAHLPTTEVPVLYWYLHRRLYISAMACISMWLPWQLFSASG